MNPLHPDYSKNSATASKKEAHPWNPLSVDPIARQFSSYAAFNGMSVTRPFAPERSIDAELIDTHAHLRQQILGQFYPCTGAVSVFSQKHYRFGLYPELGDDRAVVAVCHDLYDFHHEFPIIHDHFVTFIAMFRGPAIESESHFEELMWHHLQSMHVRDAEFFSWDPRVSSDPQNPRFSFSIGGRGIFIIGMHPKASRLARVRPYPTLVFNLHEQFDRLRERGKFDAMRQMIRARDRAFQASVNPMLTSFGEQSEARQYAGRSVPENWVCPFHPEPNGTR
jgi:FPC/CPF motif-containing protein YcgG